MNKHSSNSPITKITLLLASTLTVMAGATISPSLPAMQSYFNEVENVDFWVRLVLTIPALSIVIGSPVAGQMVDRLGRKSLLIGSAVLYGLGGSSGFLLNSLFAILIGRALLGLGVAGVMVSATTLIADYYQGESRANFMGLQSAFMGFGGVIFLTVGGYLADLNWRLPFLIYLFAWILLPLVIFSIWESKHIQDDAVSVPNSSVLPVKLLGLIYASIMLMQVVFYLIPVQLPFYLVNLSNASATQSGLAIAFCTLFSAFASMAYGKIKQRYSLIVILALSFGLMGVGNIIIGLASTYFVVLLGLVVAGMGLGLVIPNLNVWLSAEVPDSLRGRALGGLTTFMFLGQFLSPIVTQPLNNSLGLAATYGIAGVILTVLSLLLLLRQGQVCRFVHSKAGKS
jgi:MFS family permease